MTGTMALQGAEAQVALVFDASGCVLARYAPRLVELPLAAMRAQGSLQEGTIRASDGLDARMRKGAAKQAWSEAVAPIASDSRVSIDLVNATLERDFVFRVDQALEAAVLRIWDVRGQLLQESVQGFGCGVHCIEVPAGGRAQVRVRGASTSASTSAREA